VNTTPIEGAIYINGEPVGKGYYEGEHIVGNYTISFGEYEGYHAPDDEVIEVRAGETVYVPGVYRKKQKYTVKIVSDKEGADIYIEGVGWRKSPFEWQFYENTTINISFGNVTEGLMCYIPEKGKMEVKVDANKTINMHYKKGPTATLKIKTVSISGEREEINAKIYIKVGGQIVHEARGFCSVECCIYLNPVIEFGPSPEVYEEGKPKYECKNRRITIRDLKEGEVREIEGEYERIKYRPTEYRPTASILYPKDGALVSPDEFIEVRGMGNDVDGHISEYLWGVDGEFVGSGKDLKIPPIKDTGEHTITLTVVDNDRLTSEDDVVIYVYPKPEISIRLEPSVIRVSENFSERAKLVVTMDTLLREPPTVVDIQEIECEGLVIEREENIRTSVRISGGLPETREAYVSAPGMPAGSYSIKLRGYYWVEGNPERRRSIESNEVILHVERGGPSPTPTKRTPGFETIFALIGTIILAYLVRRK